MFFNYAELRMGALGICLLCFTVGLFAQSKLILFDDFPQNLGEFEVNADGSRLYFSDARNAYLVFNTEGVILDRFNTPPNSNSRGLNPLSDGWFISVNTYNGGHVGLVRPDGTHMKILVGKGGDEKVFRADMTGWSSPTAAAVDEVNRFIFAIDMSLGDDNRPWWVRIAVFDFDGKYLRDINRFQSNAAEGSPFRDESRRTTYSDIEVDPARERVYVTAAASKELLVFSYTGDAIGKAPGVGGIAVFPDGRVATVAPDNSGILMYSPELQQLAVLPARGISDLETDAAGRLYASSYADPTFIYTRWEANLQDSVTVRPHYQRINVAHANTSFAAGSVHAITVTVDGNPAPAHTDSWVVMARQSDGSDLHWQRWSATLEGDQLRVQTPENVSGFYELIVHFGKSVVDRANLVADLSVQRTVAIMPTGATRSVAAFPSNGRRVFQQGEAIPLVVARRYDAKAEGTEPITMQLLISQNGTTLARVPITLTTNYYAQLPAVITRRLSPGDYLLQPELAEHACYPLTLTIVSNLQDSPMQRILYHSFGGHSAYDSLGQSWDTPERLAYLRNYARQAAATGFTRETDRLLLQGVGPGWNRATLPAPTAAFGFAPSDYYHLPAMNNGMHDYYLEQQVCHGIRNDSHLLGHCSGVRFRDEDLILLNAKLQQFVQRRQRYPAFYGVNYNDEAFFGSWANPWSAKDNDWLKEKREGEFAGRPDAEHKIHAFDVMYQSVNAAVRMVNPLLARTHTPMWQYPAAEGSYPPALYRDMTESYSHYIGEGFQVPWYAPHSSSLLRRPGLPLMAVTDNGYSSRDNDIYAKNAMQMLARGAQGVGIMHTNPINAGIGTAFLSATNHIAKVFGPVFAEFPPLNEGALLYSYTQCVTERREHFGTPQWNRVYELHSAGLMAGVPMTIIYEEDISAGWLLPDGTPRVPMLFLVGLTQTLPETVLQGISRFIAAGGKVYTDASSNVFPNAQKLAFDTWQLRGAWGSGLDADTWQPLMQPILEQEAQDLLAAVGQHRRFPVDVATPWVSANQFDGGAVRYLMFAAEAGPLPWEAGLTWRNSVTYNKHANTSRPQLVTASFPAGTGVVYDLFAMKSVPTSPAAGNRRKLKVDLSTFPGRLFALSPAPISAPRVATGIQGDTLHFRTQMLTTNGQNLAARVPLRIRLLDGDRAEQEIYRGTDANGRFDGEYVLPMNSRGYTLEVMELCSGQATAVKVQSPPAPVEILIPRPAVEVQRVDRIRELLAKAREQGALTLVMFNESILPQDDIIALTEALQTAGVTLKVNPLDPKEPTPGVYLAAGYARGRYQLGLLWNAWTLDYLEESITDNSPGDGRGLISAVYAPRAYGEDAIALLGGDRDGLRSTVTAFIDWLANHIPLNAAPPPAAPRLIAGGTPVVAPPPTALHELIGGRLSQIIVTPEGNRMLLGGDGFLKNALLLEDAGEQARLIRSERIGQSGALQGLYLSAKGDLFGMNNRVAERYGQGFFLVDADNGDQQVFASYGDFERGYSRAALTTDGKTVVVGGAYGIACWKEMPGGWRTAWTLDYWKEFATLDWPVMDLNARIPQFNVVIPFNADYALVTFAETSNNGWVHPSYHNAAALLAVNLSDGSVRWRFDVPLKDQIFPTLYTSPNNSQWLLQAMVGSWGKEYYRFYTVRDGKEGANWQSATAPTVVALADANGNIAEANKGCALSLRRQDGALIYSLLWQAQPISLVFAADGESLYVADGSGTVSLLDREGRTRWQIAVPAVTALAISRDRLYAAAWTGRVHAFSLDGKPAWIFDCTPAMISDDPMALVAQASALSAGAVHRVTGQRSTSSEVPAGENLLANAVPGSYKVTNNAGEQVNVNGVGNEKAVLHVGGTKGWKSSGTVRVKAEQLVNGRIDDVTIPWLTLGEMHWAANTARQVWAVVSFTEPTDVANITVYEHPNYPDSWPRDAVVQQWNSDMKRWDTVAYGIFMESAVNTYTLNLQGVRMLRYVPLVSYYANFYTSEIEVR